MTPFYKTLPNVNGFGVEASANIIGAVGVAGAGAAIAAHAVGSAIHYKKQHMKEEANVSLPAFGDAPGSPDKETEE
jgi:hydrogenase small subunit